MQQISIEKLIEYLDDNINIDIFSKESNKYIIEDIFDLNYLQFINSKNFCKFDKFFNCHVDRVGIYLYDFYKNNVSLLSSILFCLDSDFCTLEIEDQMFYIKTVNEKILSDTVSHIFRIKNISKQMIISNMKNKKTINNLDIYIYACYFNINIFVFDFVTNDITLYYLENEFNMYKKNIFLSKKENQYNPLVYKNDNGRIFNYNSSILESILYGHPIKTFTLTEKSFLICNDWDKLLKKYSKIDLSTVIIDLDESQNKLLKQMINSDDSNESDNMLTNLNESLDYDMIQDSIDNNIDLDNLTEELDCINKTTNNMEEIDSDNLNLDDSDSEVDVKIKMIDNSLYDNIKQMTKSKLLKEKKENLVKYSIDFFNGNKKDLEKKNKKDLVENLFNEFKKEI